MSNESENKPARRVEDKRADSAVDWSDAPRFNALGIAETWAVTVEAEGQRVLCISDSHYAGVSEARLDQFKETIRSCAMHLLGFIGSSPIQASPASGSVAVDLEANPLYEPLKLTLGSLAFHDFAEAERIGALARSNSPAASTQQADWLTEERERVNARIAASGAASGDKEQATEQANVLPPFAAPAGQREAFYMAAIDCAHSITEERIVLHRDSTLPGNALSQMADRLEAELTRRFRAQGGNTSDNGSSASTASVAALEGLPKYEMGTQPMCFKPGTYYAAADVERLFSAAGSASQAAATKPTFWYDPSAKVERQDLIDGIWQANFLLCTAKFGNYTTPLYLAAPSSEDLRNAARYRWLRECGPKFDDLPILDARGLIIPEEFDKAIDEAMAAAQSVSDAGKEQA